MLQRWWKSYWK